MGWRCTKRFARLGHRSAAPFARFATRRAAICRCFLATFGDLAEIPVFFWLGLMLCR